MEQQVKAYPVAERVTIERLDDGTLRWHRFNRDAGGEEHIPDLSPADTLLAVSRLVGRADT